MASDMQDQSYNWSSYPWSIDWVDPDCKYNGTYGFNGYSYSTGEWAWNKS